MKKDYNEIEKISAYIDNELQPSEKEIIENKIASSPSLKDELIKYKKIKEAVSSIEKLPKDDFFETRLFEKLKSSKQSFFAKYFMNRTVLVFSSLTILFMVFLKFNPDLLNQFLETQTSNLIDFYTSNLKPLIYQQTIDKDDIFNLAFNRFINVDKQNNQMLMLGEDENGKEFFEVKYAGNVSNAINLETFVRSLKLNEKQKKQVDSILDSYSDDIATQIFVNDKNTVAVNPNIWNYHNAIRADLISFAENVNENALKKFYNSSFIEKSVKPMTKMVSSINQNDDNCFLFITPDTIFSKELEFDKEELKREFDRLKNDEQAELQMHKKAVESYKIAIKNNLKSIKIDSIYKKGLNFYFDSNYCRVKIPSFAFEINSLPNMDSMNKMLQDAIVKFKDFNMNFNYDSSDGRKSFSFSYKYKGKRNPDSLNAFKFNFQMPKFPKITPMNLDSLMKAFDFRFNDSMHVFNQNDLKKELKLFRKEMEKFREEMQRFKKDFKENQEKKKVPQIREINYQIEI